MATEKENLHIGSIRLALEQKNHGIQAGKFEACAPLLAKLVAQREDDMSEASAPPTAYRARIRNVSVKLRMPVNLVWS